MKRQIATIQTKLVIYVAGLKYKNLTYTGS